MKHRLVACLHADVSGYSRLITDNVAETARLRIACQVLIGDAVATYGGRVIDVSGDSLLAVFPTVPPAVRCAVEVQRRLRVGDAGSAPRRRMQFRAGIEFGEVVLDDGRISGDGVNVATRVQELAAPGRICLAGSAFDRVSPLSLPCQYLGERTVKDIDRPVRIYQVGAGCGA